MNNPTTQSLEEIFEKGKINELQKLNEGLHTRFPNLNGKQMIVAKARFIKDNELAFCNEFNQGSRYKDALLEFENALLKNQLDFKSDSFSENVEFIQNEILNHWGLGVNRKQLFLDFFEEGLKKIAFDLGRKQAWREFGFITNIANDETSNEIIFKCLVSDEMFTEHLYKRWCGVYIEEIPYDDFKKHMRGDIISPKLNWVGKLYELIRFMDMLHFCFNPRMYKGSSVLFNPVSVHFLLNNQPLKSNSWDKTRYNYKDKNGVFDSKFKNIENIISELQKKSKIKDN